MIDWPDCVSHLFRQFACRCCLTWCWQHVAILWGSDRNVENRNAQLYYILPSPSVLKLKEVFRQPLYCYSLLDMHFTTTQPCFCKDIPHVFYKHLVCTFYMAWESDKVKFDPSGQTETNTISNNTDVNWNMLVKNYISCFWHSHLLNMIEFHLFEYILKCNLFLWRQSRHYSSLHSNIFKKSF